MSAKLKKHFNRKQCVQLVIRAKRIANSKYGIYILTACFFIWVVSKYNTMFKQDIEYRLQNENQLVKDDDPDLVEYVRKHYIFTNPSITENRVKPGGLEGMVDYLLRQNLIELDVPGYFVEIGANDGLHFTSTLYLEQHLGWEGLLVEPVSEPFQKLRSSRKAVLSNATISSQPYPNEEKFHFNPSTDLWGGLTYRFYKWTTSFKTVLSIPLYTLLLAAECPNAVDLLVMDIEGAELDVLKTIPFDKLRITIIVVETFNGMTAGQGAVNEFLLGKGYHLVGHVNVPLDQGLAEKISTIIGGLVQVHSEYYVFKLG